MGKPEREDVVIVSDDGEDSGVEALWSQQHKILRACIVDECTDDADGWRLVQSLHADVIFSDSSALSS